MPGGWELPGEETARRVLSDLQRGDIVVLHDGRVGLILEELTARGLRAVTISDLVSSR
jgi:pyruvate kinase